MAVVEAAELWVVGHTATENCSVKKEAAGDVVSCCFLYLYA